MDRIREPEPETELGAFAAPVQNEAESSRRATKAAGRENKVKGKIKNRAEWGPSRPGSRKWVPRVSSILLARDALGLGDTYPPVLHLSTCHQDDLDKSGRERGQEVGLGAGAAGTCRKLSRLPLPTADLDPVLPDQAPEVQQGVRQRALCGDVGLTSVRALREPSLLPHPPRPTLSAPFPGCPPDPDEVAIDVVTESLLLEQGQDHACLIICQWEKGRNRVRG